MNSKIFVAVVVPVFNLCAATYEWTGNAGGEWNAPGNWTVEGVAATAAPASGDTLSIGAATSSKPFAVNTTVTIPNPIVLGSGQQVFHIGANGVRATLTGVVSGAGGIKATYLNNNTYLRLSGANTFAGGVTRDGAGQVEITHASALGTGDFVGKNPASGAMAVALSVRGDNLTIANNLTFYAEGLNGNGYGGCASFQSTTHLTGTVTFNGDTRIGGGSAVHFDGPTVIKGRLTTNAEVDYYFNTAITGGGYLHTDQCKGRWHLMQPGNNLSKIYVSSSSGTHRMYLKAENAVPDTFFVQYGDTVNADSAIDLCGHATTMERLYNGAPKRVVTASSPATLTLASRQNATWGGSCTGMLSVDYAPTGAYTLTSSGGAHTMSGTLKVSNGTFKTAYDASFSSLMGLDVASGATFEVDTTAGDVAALTLNVASGAVLKLGAGRTVTVKYATVGGTPLAAGTYTSASQGVISGSGSLVVTEGGTAANLWIWSGAAGGDWTTPGNWVVNGAAAQSAPPSTATLYLATAGAANPFTVLTTTTVPNDIVLAGTQQIISNATNKGTAILSGTISGDGGIKAVFANDGSLRLEGDNTFAGGVTRCQPGELSLYSNTAAGTGPIDLGNGSAQSSGVDNKPGLYVKSGLTIANTLKVGAESYVSWNGWWDGASGGTVHFAGDVWFNGQTRYWVPGTIYYDGTVHQAGRQVAKSGSGGQPNVYYRNAIQPNNGTKGNIYPDNGSCIIHLQASSNQLSAVQLGNVADFRLYLEAPDALAGVPVSWESAASVVNAGTRIDLCGHDQHVLRLKDIPANNPSNHVVTSTSRAKLTVNQNEADNTFLGRIAGGVSLELDASNAANVFRLAGNVLHDASGDFVATKGVLRIEGGSRAPNLHAIEVGASGSVVVDATAGEVNARTLTVAAGGTLTLPADRTLTVKYLRAGGVCVSTPTTFTKENATWLAEGTVVVTGLQPGYLTWTGDVGGEWTAAGNWLNDQGEAEAPVTTGVNLSRLFLTGAGQGTPLRFSQATEVNNEILLDDGQQTLECAANVAIRGPVSGAGGLLKMGTADLALYGDQAFTGGVESKDGTLSGHAVGAFGPGLVKVGAVFNGHAALRLMRGQTYANDFEIESLVSAGGQNCCATIDGINSSGRLTLSGNVHFVRNAKYGMNHFRFNFPITFSGTVTMAGTSACDSFNGHSVVTKTGGVVFENPIVCTSGCLYFFTDQNGADITFRGANNPIKWLELWGNTQKYYLDCENALREDSCIRMQGGFGSTDGAAVDLCGHDQTLEAVYDAAATAKAHAIVSPAGPATITMKAATHHDYLGDFADAISLVWDPKGDYVYTITNTALTTTGSITVKRGEVRLFDASAVNVSAIEVKTGAAFRLRGLASLGSTVPSLVLEENATLDLNGQVGVFDAVTYRGEPLAGGQVYTHATLPELAEGTSLSVGAIEAVWTGAGGTTLTTVPGNWQDGLPNLADGSVVAVFATGGAQATLAADTFLRGVALNAAHGFAIGGSLGTEVLNVGANGVGVTAPSGTRTDAFNVPVAATAAQTWRVAGEGENILELNAGIQVPEGRTVRREQTSRSILRLNGASAVNGRLELTNGATTVTGEIGGTGTVAWWRGVDVNGVNNLNFRGSTSTCDWEFTAQNPASAYSDGTVTFAANTTNRFEGRVSTPENNQLRPIAYAGSSTVFAGGYDFKTVFVPRGSGNAEFVFTGTPGQCVGITDDSTGYTPHLRFCSPGHNLKGDSITLCGSSTLDIEVDNAITNMGGFYLFSTCRVNLNGHDFACTRLSHSSAYITASPIGPVIASSTPATLTVAETANVSNCVAFAEAASLRKTAAGRVDMYGASTSTGVVDVVQGTLGFRGNGSWRKAGVVRIAAGATNVLGHHAVYGPETRVELATGGTLTLDFEGHQKLGAFMVDGVAKTPGRYCAPGNASSISHGAVAVQGLSGTGEVMIGEFGTVLIFR